MASRFSFQAGRVLFDGEDKGYLGLGEQILRSVFTKKYVRAKVFDVKGNSRKSPFELALKFCKLQEERSQEQGVGRKTEENYCFLLSTISSLLAPTRLCRSPACTWRHGCIVTTAPLR